MNYCIRYNNKSEQLDNVQEVSIVYDGQDQSLVDYLSVNCYVRTILRVQDVAKFLENEEWRKLNAIRRQYPSYKFAVCFCVGNELDSARPVLEALDTLSFEWFIDAPIKDWDQLRTAAAIGVSDVYIAEELGFEMPQVYKFCHSHNIKVRVYPNIAQSSTTLIPNIRAFFIRPEDIDVYASYIDCLEFYGPIEKQDVLLRIYRETKIWPYDLSVLILGLPSINSALIKKDFGLQRLDCGKICLRNGGCDICGHVAALSKLAKENNIAIKYKFTR